MLESFSESFEKQPQAELAIREGQEQKTFKADYKSLLTKQNQITDR